MRLCSLSGHFRFLCKQGSSPVNELWVVNIFLNYIFNVISILLWVDSWVSQVQPSRQCLDRVSDFWMCVFYAVPVSSSSLITTKHNIGARATHMNTAISSWWSRWRSFQEPLRFSSTAETSQLLPPSSVHSLLWRTECICLKYTSIINCISNTLVWWNSNEIPSQIRISGAEVGNYPLGSFSVWKTTLSVSPVNFIAQNFTILINLEMWHLMQICSNLSICEFFLKNIWVWWTVKFWHALFKHDQECLLK